MVDNAGDHWFLYHSWIGPKTNINFYPPGRVLNIDKIVWTVDGWPHIGFPSDTPQLKPSVASTQNVNPIE